MKSQKAQISILLGLAVLAGASLANADPRPRIFQIGPQTPALVSPGGLAEFAIAIDRTGFGSMDVQMSVAGLPAGANYSFLPLRVATVGQPPSTKNASLLIRVESSTPAGSYPFTITARHGGSPNAVTVSGTLVVGTGPVVIRQPVLNPPVLLDDGSVVLSGTGTPNLPLVVEATTDLSTGIWVQVAVVMPGLDGIFSLIDTDATLYPMRFYRAVQ